MTHLTRDVLIKTIVAEEMVGCGGTDYVQNLKSAYHRWEHESSETLCKKYNKIKKLNNSKNVVIGFGITEKTIKSLKKADGLVVGSAICKEISKSIEKRQNAVTNVTNIVKRLKNKYFNVLNDLIEVLQYIKEHPFMSNEALNKLSLKAKNLIDDLYNSINYYYIFAIMYS